MSMDRKTVAAIVLSVLFLVAYQPLLRWMGFGKYIDAPRRPAATAMVDSASTDSTASPSPSSPSPEPVGVVAPPEPGRAAAPGQIAAPPFQTPVAAFERSLSIDTPLYHAEFSNRGARLVSVALKRYASAFGESGQKGRLFHPRPGQDVPPEDRVVLAGAPTFLVELAAPGGTAPLADAVYAVQESLGVDGDVRALTFTAGDTAGFYVRQTYRVRPQDYALDLEIEIRGVPAAWKVSEYSLNTRSWPLLTDSDRAADLRGLRASSLVGTNVRREHSGGLMKAPKHFEGNVRWAGVQNRYFADLVAVVDATPVEAVASGERVPLTDAQRALLPPKEKAERDVVMNALRVRLPSETNPVNRFLLYVGPTQYDRMSKLGAELDRAVDLGWRWLEPFSKALLVVLKWLYGVLHNYGVAILLLATLVRVILHPLNMTSMKSMRAMQRLQPEIERIKAKYKDNPQGMNTAMMALYKEHKVNPAGGCLPMVLQMPLFIALYSVLFNAIELRQAPFMLWVNDLSAPDKLFEVASFPIRLLPLLMAGTGYLQMKMMPQTTAQGAPNMSIMNLVMLVFFYNLPSGLVLYWTVMNVLTIAQQWLVMRQDAPLVAGSHAVVVEQEPVRKGGRRQKMAKRPSEK
jgi:YidC/Oxa1 family membrane protein insertase